MSNRWKMLSWLLAALVLALYGYQCVRKGNDFRTFYDIGVLATQRANVYAPSPRTGMYVFYLPHFALLMMPWTLLPWQIAATLWFCLKAALLMVVGRAFLRLRRPSSEDDMRSPVLRSVSLVFPMLLCASFLNDEFRLGQVNFLVFCLLLGTFSLLRKGRTGLASLCLVVATIKVTPLIFVPYFVIRREWSLVRGAVAWSLGFALMAMVWFGPSQTARQWRDWYRVSQTEKLSARDVSFPKNQSVSGFVARLFVDRAEAQQAETTPDPKEPLVRIIVIAATAGLVGTVYLMIALCRGAHGGHQWAMALLFTTMLLVSPDTRTAHMVHLLQPLALLWCTRRCDGQRKPILWALFSWFVFAFGLMGKDIWGAHLYVEFQYLSIQFWAMLTLLAALLWSVGRRRNG